MFLIRRHHISFKHAFDGVKYAFFSQPNFRVHLILSALAIYLSYALNVSAIEFTIIILTIVFGLGVEMVNTSIESMTDLITQEYKQEAKIAKDLAAGMMLLTAVGAVIVAGFIFLPKIYDLL